MPLLLFFKSFIPAHTRRLKNGKVVTVQAYSDKRLRKDAIPVHVDPTGIKAEDKGQWARLHKEQHVLHHTDKALHERRIKEANEAVAHHNKKAAHHEAQRDLARKNGDSAALSEHNKALTHHHNRAAAWGVKRGSHERHLAKVDAKLEGIKALKEKLWAGSGEVGEDEQKLLNRVPYDAPTIKTDGGDIGKARNISEMSKMARDYAQKNFAGKTVRNKDTGDTILISMKGVKHTTYNAQADLLKTVAVLPEILEKSKYIGNDEDKSQPNTKVHYYGVKIKMDEKILDVVSVVKEDGNGNRYYDHSIERDGGRAVQRISKTTPEMPPHEPEGSDKSITEPPEKASGPAKITPTGKTNEVKTAQGTKVNTQFAVVEASDLTTSHDANGNANPNYPGELQPRNRGRDTSQAQIARIAKNLDPDLLGRTRNASNGAPIVGSDGVVESGNGRTLAINQAYQSGKADDYRDWLEDIADTYGLDAKQIQGMKNPVLVRVRTSGIDRAQFAREANQSDMLAMTATEKAKADANHLTDAVIGKLQADGDLSSANNRDFIMAFMGKLGDDESAGLSTTDGKPTKQLYDRAQAAIFSKAYNDDRLLELMADEAKPDIANIIKSLNQAAPSFIKARELSEHHTQATTGKLTDAVGVSLDKQAVDAIVKATEALKKAKDSNMPIEKLIAQGDMFGGIDPVVAQMALFIKDNNRSASRMGEAFTAMADYLVTELTGRQNESLFGDETPINMIDVLKAANAQLQKHYGDNAKAIGGRKAGGFIDIFTETRGQKADREKFLAGDVSAKTPSEAPKKRNDGYGITKKDDHLLLKTPFNENMVAEAKTIGGKWDADAGSWVFPDFAQDKVEEMDMKYNSPPVPVEITFHEEAHKRNGRFSIAGVPVATAYGRDSGAKISNGIAFVTHTPKSGGSVKNWVTLIPEGAVVRMRIPEALLDDAKSDRFNFSVKRIDDYQENGNEKTESKRIYLNVPFNDKDTAKKHGARWDSGARSWYVNDKVPNQLEQFTKSLSQGMQLILFFKKAMGDA